MVRSHDEDRESSRFNYSRFEGGPASGRGCRGIEICVGEDDGERNLVLLRTLEVHTEQYGTSLGWV